MDIYWGAANESVLSSLSCLTSQTLFTTTGESVREQPSLMPGPTRLSTVLRYPKIDSLVTFKGNFFTQNGAAHNAEGHAQQRLAFQMDAAQSKQESQHPSIKQNDVQWDALTFNLWEAT